MNSHKTFSLSLQKQIEKRNFSMETETNKALNELNIRSLLHQSNIRKQKGYATISLFYLLILLPFLKQRLSWFWSGKCFLNQLTAQKDTFYRFLNHERFNWRKLVYLLALKVISKNDDVPLRQKTIIADDTIGLKTGEHMELVSYHFDHKTRRSVLGYQYLQLGYHNGINFFPLDVAPHTSEKRPNLLTSNIDKRTNGWKRRSEALRKKTDVLIDMLSHTWLYGIDAAFVMFDSWFAHDIVISKINQIGYGVICRLKRGRVKYTYNGHKYTLKQLWHNVARKRTRWLGKFQVKAVCLNVSLPKSGDIRVAFVSDGKKQWHAFLCTDLELDASEILTYYARRWAIELFFKDAKQMLYLGNEQSKTFDAIVACYSLVMIRYLLLVYILNKYTLTGPLGPLFRDMSDDHLTLLIAEQMWLHVKELLIKSSHIISYKIEPDVLFYLIDIIEEVVLKQMQISTAKL